MVYENEYRYGNADNDDGIKRDASGFPIVTDQYGNIVKPNEPEKQESGWGVDDVLGTIGKALPIATTLFGVFGNRPELLNQNNQFNQQINQQNQQNPQMMMLMMQQQQQREQEEQRRRSQNTTLIVVVSVLVIGAILFFTLRK